MDKQITRVLEALQAVSCATSRDISLAIGLPLNKVSAHLSELGHTGAARKTGRVVELKRGTSLQVWEAVR